MASELNVIRGGNSRVRGSVIFVHGLGGDPYQTWGGDTQKAAGFWPGWLADEKPLKELAFYTLKLPTPPTGSPLSIRDIAAQVFNLLTTSPHSKALLNVPIAFVCHSLGGLIVKDLIVLTRDLAITSGSVDSAASRLFNRIAQVTFIATPHKGSMIATALSGVPGLSSQLANDLVSVQHEEYLDCAKGNPLVAINERMINCQTLQ